MPLNSYDGYWAGLPQTTGRYFFVSPSDTYSIEGRTYTASDGHPGTDVRQSLRTINQAWTKVTAGVGDVIVLLPGTHTPASPGTTTAEAVAANVAGVSMVGMAVGFGNTLKPQSIITGPAALGNIVVTAADITIANLAIIPITQQIGISLSAAANGLQVADCYFDLNTPAAHTSTKGIVATGAASRVLIRGCFFDSDGAQGPAIDATATVTSRIENNVFNLTAGSWAVGILCGGGTTGLQIRTNAFLVTGTAITAPISGTGATIAHGVLINDNRFSVLCTVPVDNFDASEADMSSNYTFASASTGGVLITAIT